MDRALLEALRRRAAEEGREEYEILDEAARFYLEHGDRAGVPEPSEDEAMRIAVAEQHVHRSEARGPGG